MAFSKYLAKNYYPVQYNNEYFWTTWDWGGACPFNPTFPPAPLFKPEDVYKEFCHFGIAKEHVTLESAEEILHDYYSRFPGFKGTASLTNENENLYLYVDDSEIGGAYFPNAIFAFCGRSVEVKAPITDLKTKSERSEN